MLKIMGLGPGAYEALTIGALKELKNNKNIYFRTEKHPTVDFLKDEGIKFESYDHAYEKYDSFDDVYKYIAEDLITKIKDDEDLIYAVPGHPLVAEKSVINLIELCKENNIQYEVLPAVSFVDAMMEALQVDPIEGVKIIDAFDMKNQILDKRVGTIITQVYNNFIASEVKLRLLEGYEDDTEIIFVRAAGVEGLESIRKIPLYELDWQEDIDYLTSIYIPKDLGNKKDFQDLLDIIETLRNPGGCPWDREQTHESLKSALLEECYEVIDAIENEDEDALIEELGDVLLQVVFHASIGKEDGYFDIMDVIGGISNKMINRHPHVFGNEEVNTSEQVLVNWDEIKKEEKGIKTLTEEMQNIAKSLPATTRAYKVQKKAKKVGFDWDDVNCAMDKVKEELNEIKEVYNCEDKSIIEGEVGDLLFACINVARFLEVDGELALDKTIKKFIKRFSYIENEAIKNNKNLKDMTLEEMDKLWEEAKTSEK
ncbi:nucleoside triphosphate pyrophosphohydrolase [Clostridium perfringens]|uniref:MazG family protein n=1 Tax=Clostridium perfringens (strain ATCC 13124 / DSM 756 / JCM 1290 / NCIMB 6125 / NCTC 8237 / Type A) TaxID=195103 RepID=A0A0H2YT24_CLOP1|nr:nucleoside triphosphate pyrophosphohydrolase [Clostridium perfringens]ABG84158.1 MazG family protein [Clostridium perfringens ATCC 13124]EDT27251.1 MazG family protein [Clostridium perfringens CPE str. F4969]EGT0680926.1 nucleoside triphosphate pyrophosphohydrolase [Clostridium perfringens]MBI6005526.1 nucleoside triphosphate pyrophosphohydrolase [Clostridium perfringens]MBI6009782.1 nucleoside triphosphate pyrophosphohydrolase [Clostridium perfringens]